jgi:endonuclease/exonuclease/phosphatase (EEP) superfamily protein YafD
MITTYYDSWAEAVKKGIAVAYADNPDGNTRHTRIDYIYYSHGASALVLRKVQVFDTRSSGIMPSDHRPLMATFTVK